MFPAVTFTVFYISKIYNRIILNSDRNVLGDVLVYILLKFTVATNGSDNVTELEMKTKTEETERK